MISINLANKVTLKKSSISLKPNTSCLPETRLASDIFQCNNKLSFKKTEGPSQKTLDYMKNMLKYPWMQIDSLSQLDLSKIEDIAQGIPIFEGWTSYDLYLLSDNFDSLLLQRGCAHQCSHCAAESIPKIKTMKWDNFKAIAEGIGELKNRLGFNTFKTSGEDFIYPFQDSDPMIFRSPTIDPQTKQVVYKDIHDSAALFYTNTGTQFLITTAGWSPNNIISQNAALKMVNNSSPINEVGYSISPFHHHLELSRQYKNQANIETNPIEKQKLLKKSEDMENRYIDMVANNLITLWPLKSSGKLNIGILYDNNSSKDRGYQDVIKILTSIHSRMKKIIVNRKITLSPILPDNIYRLFQLERAIVYRGKAINIAPQDIQTQENIRTNKIKDWQDKIINEQNYKEIVGKATSIDTDGSILSNLLPQKLGRVSSVTFHPVKISNKQLNLPIKDPENDSTNTNTLPWPPENYIIELIKKRNLD